MKVARLMGVGLILAGQILRAGVETITLDLEPPDDGLLARDVILDRGFEVAGDDSFQLRVGGENRPTNGTYHLPLTTGAVPMNVSNRDAEPFTALQIDMAEYSAFAIPENNEVVVTATFTSGDKESHIFVLDGVFDGPGPGADFETFEFPAHWTNLRSLSIETPRVALDNIVVRGHSIPEIVEPERFAPVAYQRTIAQIFSPGAYQRWHLFDVTEAGMRFLSADFRGIQDDGRQMLVAPDGGVTTGDTGDDILSGESVEIDASGIEEVPVLISRAGSKQPLVYAGGGHEVGRFSHLAASGGAAAVVNNGYRNLEQYAVFIMTPDELIPVVVPDTVLPDGGTPFHFPDSLFFEDGTVAFDSSSSTSSQSDGFFLRFPNGELRIGIREDDRIPGTEEQVTGVGSLLSLNRSRARYVVVSAAGDYVVETHSDGSHSVLSSPPAAGSSVRGYGIHFQGRAQAYDEVDGMTYYVGSGEIPETSLSHYAACGVVDGEYRIALEGSPIRGQDDMVITLVGAYGGKLYGAGANHRLGQYLLVEVTASLEVPAPAIRDVLITADGSLRFTAIHLTLGEGYAVESLLPGGASWEVLREFSPGAWYRSVLGRPEPGQSEFFRLRTLPQLED